MAETVVTKTVQLYRKQKDFLEDNSLFRAFAGGIGCLAAETEISGIPIADRQSIGQVSTLFGSTLASASFLKGQADLYRVGLSTEMAVTATLSHRFLTPTGWRRLSDLCVGSLVAADGMRYDRSGIERSKDFSVRYSSGFRQSDELPTPAAAAVLDRWRQLHKLGVGDSAWLVFDLLLSIEDSLLQMEDQRGGVLCHFFPSDCEQFPGQYCRFSLFQWLIRQRDIWQKLSRLANQLRENCFCLCQQIFRILAEFSRRQTDEGQTSRQLDAGFCNRTNSELFFPSRAAGEDRVQFCSELSDKQSRLFQEESLPYSNDYWAKIQDVQFVKRGDFYDLHVPDGNHYSGNGIYHHNSGKSWVGAYDMIRRAKPDRLYMVTAPTYTLMADASFRSFEKIARDLDFVSDIARGSTPYIKLKTGAEILFRSAHEPEMLRGPNLSGVWMDEASLMKQDAYDILIGRLREGGELGWLTSTFTPKGKSHWTFKKFGTGQPDTKLFHAKTHENPFLPDLFYETRRKQYSAQQAEQELGGAFLDGAGNHFHPGSWRKYYDIEDGSLAVLRPGGTREIYIKSDYQIIIALDWAMGKKKKTTTKSEFLDDDGRSGDYTAFVVCALTHGGLLFILDVVNARISLEENAPCLAELCRRWRPWMVAGDDDMLSETMLLDCRRYRDIPEVKRLPIAGRDKRVRATAAIIHGENGRILLPQETQRHKYPWLEAFADQLSSFTGLDDEHDDMVDSLGIIGRIADDLKGDGREESFPDLLIPARDLFGAY